MLFNTGDMKPGQFATNDFDRLQVYNALDTCITLEVREELGTLFSRPPETYDFARALQAPALEMMLRGFAVDETERHMAVAELGEKIRRLERQLNSYAYAVWGKPLNPRSPIQVRDFFYGAMQIPPVWKSVKGEKKLSSDRETLEKLEVYFYARPIIATILAIRDLAKQLEVFTTEIDPDGRMRTSYNIVGTETGRWCLDGSTEVLSKNGWVSLKDWEESAEIAVWSPSKEIKFAPCKKLIFNNTEPLVRITNSRMSLLCTKEHRLPYFTSKQHFASKFAGERKTLHSLPVAGQLTGDFADELHTRIAVMMQADGHILNSRSIRFHFKKLRKIRRCYTLLAQAGLSVRMAEPADGSTYIYVKDAPNWLVEAKFFGPWLLAHNPKTVLDELPHWDGDKDRNGATVFYTSNLDNAKWVKTIAHLAGHFASLREKKCQDTAWQQPYRVYIGCDDTTRIYAKDYVDAEIAPLVYCAETPTGFFLVRHRGEISVTGNSSSSSSEGTGRNIQNIDRALRRVFVADPGYKLGGIDLEQAESREVGWQCGILFDEWSYLDACYQGDLHTLTCRMCWKDLPWTGDLKKDRTIADQIFYRTFSYRDMSKKLGHGSNYFGTAFTMARHAKIPTKWVEDFQDGYFAGFPGIAKWHSWVAGQIQTTHRLVTPWGRERQFFGRPNDDTTLREAIAFVPQSATADRMNLGLWRVWKTMGTRVQILAQVHDAIYFQFPETADEVAVMQEALALIDIRTSAKGHELVVPGEAKTGWNWGDFNDDPAKGRINPMGLKKLKGPDPRTRLTGLDRIL